MKTKDQLAAERVQRKRALRLQAWEAYKADGIDADLPDGVSTIPQILRRQGAACSRANLQAEKLSVYRAFGQKGLDLFVDGFVTNQALNRRVNNR